MISPAPQNLKRPIHLLYEDEAHELMRIREAAERHLEVGAAQDGGREAEGTADDEGELAAAVRAEAADLLRELFRGEQLPVDGECDDVGAFLQLRENAHAFAGDGLLLLRRAHRVGRFLVRHFDDAHFRVGAEPFHVFGDAVDEIFFLQLADGDDLYVHARLTPFKSVHGKKAFIQGIMPPATRPLLRITRFKLASRKPDQHKHDENNCHFPRLFEQVAEVVTGDGDECDHDRFAHRGGDDEDADWQLRDAGHDVDERRRREREARQHEDRGKPVPFHPMDEFLRLRVFPFDKVAESPAKMAKKQKDAHRPEHNAEPRVQRTLPQPVGVHIGDHNRNQRQHRQQRFDEGREYAWQRT